MKNKIKILYIISDLKSGGVENMLYNYISLMDKEKYKFSFITHGCGGMIEEKLKKLGYEIFHVIPRKKNILANIFGIWKCMNNEKWDIVHSNINQVSAIPILIAKYSGIKVRIAHAHGNSFSKYFPMKNISKILSYILVKNANYLIACGKDAAINVFGKKYVNQKKIIYLRNAINLLKFEYNNQKAKEFKLKHGFKEKYMIIHVARFTKEKNHLFTIELFHELTKRESDIRLLLIGEGPLKNEINRKVNSFGINDKVSFLGVRENVYEYYTIADCLLLPSFHEGLPLVPIEAQAAGLLCYLSTNVPEETIVTKNVFRLDLKLGPSIWADIVLESIKKINNNARYSNLDDLKKNGFDINIEVKKLGNIYSKLINK